MLTYRTLFCFGCNNRSSVFQLYCAKDYYKQKQWNTLPVTMITEIMKLIYYYGGCHGISGKYLCLAILTNMNIYMCYDYVHLDNLSDISSSRNHNVQQCKMQIP